MASIARDAEAMVGSDGFCQEEPISGLDLAGVEELLDKIEAETDLQLAL